MSTYWVKCNDDIRTYLDMLNSFVDEFYPGVDYDPECLFNPDMLDKTANTEVFNNSKLDIIMTLEATTLNNNSSLN